MAGAKNIAEAVREVAIPVAESLGYTVWDVEFVKEGTQWVLRITIDSEEGITIDDCERMHRTIDPVIDELDPIEIAYNLEISSPGLERELRTDAHIEYAIGEQVELRLFAPVEGKRRFEGVLVGRGENGEILLDDGRRQHAFPRAAVAKLRTVFEF